MLNANIANLLYLVSGVLFVLALRGLSHPTTSRRGNMLGVAGMALAGRRRPSGRSGRRTGARRPGVAHRRGPARPAAGDARGRGRRPRRPRSRPGVPASRQLRLDPLALLFVTLSVFLWLLTTIYAIAYFDRGPNLPRFFGYAIGVARRYRELAPLLPLLEPLAGTTSVIAYSLR